MDDPDLLHGALELINETLTTTIVIVAASILLYNLSRRLHDRVTRAASIVLGLVVVAYVADVFVSLDPGGTTTSKRTCACNGSALPTFRRRFSTSRTRCWRRPAGPRAAPPAGDPHQLFDQHGLSGVGAVYRCRRN